MTMWDDLTKQTLPSQSAGHITFSSAQDPRSWEPNVKREGVVLTCLTNEDAKRAEKIFNELLRRAETAERENSKLKGQRDELVKALEYINDCCDGREDIEDRKDGAGVRPNIFMRIASEARNVIAKLKEAGS